MQRIPAPIVSGWLDRAVHAPACTTTSDRPRSGFAERLDGGSTRLLESGVVVGRCHRGAGFSTVRPSKSSVAARARRAAPDKDVHLRAPSPVRLGTGDFMLNRLGLSELCPQH